jgi:hypothetical protein
MLPITALFKKKNAIGNLHEDVFLDIFTDKLVGNKIPGGKERADASHGMAMGLLNPAMNTPESLGFGIFRGLGKGLQDTSTEEEIDPNCNIYMIGYAHSSNFISAICNGVAGAFDMTLDGTKYEKADDYINALRRRPNEWTADYFCNQMHDQAATPDSPFNFLEIRTEQSNHDEAWRHFRDAGQSGNGKLGNQRL